MLTPRSMPRSWPAAALALLASAALSVANAHSAFAAEHYAGRRVTVVINYAAGGPADIEGRLFARHVARHIAGGPNVIVQNMDGAGGLIGTNYIGEIAPKDGTVVGLLTGAAWQYASETKPRRVDFRSYEFVAYQPGTTVYFMRTDVKPGMKLATDLGRAEGLVSGGLGADNGKDLLLRLTLDMLGHKYKYVTGYRGSNAARLALQQGEINYYGESPPSYRAVVEPGLVAKGEVIALFYDADFDGRDFRMPKQVEGLGLQPFHEIHRQIRGTLPSGQLWAAYRAIVALNHGLQRIVALPPGAPPAAVDALRQAIRRLDQDREFADDAVRTFGYVPEFVADADTSARVRAAMETSPEMKAFIAQYIAAGTTQK